MHDAGAPDPALVARLRDSRERVLEQIAAAAERAGRDRAEVTLVAVTKGFGSEVAQAAVEAGLTTLGENRVQEAESKAGVAGATWHLIGPLQSNKARRAVERFDVIESVDSHELAQRLARLATDAEPVRSLPVFVQVNVDADPAKAGFAPAALEAELGKLLELPGLRFEGLMTVGRLVSRSEDARPTFQRLRALSERLRGQWPRLGPGLSMGMSDDYPVAVEEGATIVRVGRALFGDWPAPR